MQTLKIRTPGMIVLPSPNNKFCAFDEASGGYPYEDSFFRAVGRGQMTPERALQTLKSCPEWKEVWSVDHIEVYYDNVTDEIKEVNRLEAEYQKELSVLNKKYRRS